ncbi:mitochondrial carrier [Thozetella sp. PMI_491]|nr:mitochondrial carrier [Thozetella sp. PMI_491]
MKDQSIDVLHAPFITRVLPFINGGAAGMIATTIIQPVDMIKVHLQLAGEGGISGAKASPLSVTRKILAHGRVADLYTGISAGLLRQAIYTTARLGLFDASMKALMKRAEDRGNSLSFVERAVAALSAGGVAAFLGNPADLALVRMQTDGLKSPDHQKNYKSAIQALSSIIRDEGPRALWTGATPTVARAMALNLGQLAFFSEAKAQFVMHTDWSPSKQTLAASAIAGFFASILGVPFDFVKTRLQKQQKGADGILPYKSLANCFYKVAKEEGVTRFYRGFGTAYMRIAPHTMVTLIVVDYLNWISG